MLGLLLDLKGIYLGFTGFYWFFFLPSLILNFLVLFFKFDFRKIYRNFFSGHGQVGEVFTWVLLGFYRVFFFCSTRFRKTMQWIFWAFALVWKNFSFDFRVRFKYFDPVGRGQKKRKEKENKTKTPASSRQ